MSFPTRIQIDGVKPENENVSSMLLLESEGELRNSNKC
jgi:hypothetical protein